MLYHNKEFRVLVLATMFYLIALAASQFQQQAFPAQRVSSFQNPPLQQLQYPVYLQQVNQFAQPYFGASNGNYYGNNYFPSYLYSNVVNNPVTGNPVVQQPQIYNQGYGLVPAAAGVTSTSHVVRDNPRVAATTAADVEAPKKGGHYEIYKYGRDGLNERKEEEPLDSMNPLDSIINIRNPNYEVFNWGTLGYY